MNLNLQNKIEKPSLLKFWRLSSLTLLALLLNVTQTSLAAAGSESNISNPAAYEAKNDAVEPMQNPFEHKAQKMDKIQQIELAQADLSEKKNVQIKDVKLLSAQSVTWRSGALGCPEPGMQYTQALVKGMQIILQSKGKQYRYHASANGKPFYCEASRIELPANNSADV